MKQVDKDTFVIIPAKPLAQSKTRLAGVLPLNERVELSRYLLRRTIRLARQIGQVVVISRDGAVRQLAKQAGAWALVEVEEDLNKAVQQASQWVIAHSGQAILVLPGDLPLLHRSDLLEIVEAGQSIPAVVIAPSRRLDGTNALFLRPPSLIPFAFGPGSFGKHQQAARARGVEPVIYRSATLALDLDLPEDLTAWQKQTQI